MATSDVEVPVTPSHSRFPSAAECAPIAVLALAVLTDLRRWASTHPVVAAVPLEAMAITAATVSPWRDARQLRPAARMYAWTYALDDHVEQNITALDDLDDLFRRCDAVVHGGEPDDSQPLLAALSEWQADACGQPLYPRLVGLWTEKFTAALAGMRYDWIAGRSRLLGQGPSDLQEYLRHSDSILVWITYLPRWFTDEPGGPLTHLDVLTSAMDDIQVVVRLANDLATFSWERTQPGQNNILMYGTTPDWVRGELTRRAEAARRQLAPLVADDFRPAHEMIRLLDWAVGFYDLADFRGWGSDVPVTSTSDATSHPE